MRWPLQWWSRVKESESCTDICSHKLAPMPFLKPSNNVQRNRDIYGRHQRSSIGASTIIKHQFLCIWEREAKRAIWHFWNYVVLVLLCFLISLWTSHNHNHQIYHLPWTESCITSYHPWPHGEAMVKQIRSGNPPKQHVPMELLAPNLKNYDKRKSKQSIKAARMRNKYFFSNQQLPSFSLPNLPQPGRS